MNQPDQQPTLTVSELNRQTRQLLERSLGMLWVQGEIADLATPRSGHIYLTLKDAGAQIRCALFRNRATALRFSLESGQEVRALAKVSLYEPRGDYQLIIERIEASGEGLLKQALLKLKKNLTAAGLFASAHKQALPSPVTQVGVITSATGAALHDILTVLRRRSPQIKVIIYPSSVQGHRAAPELVAALAIANTRAECDVLIIARGGGSLEDLWPFNEEMVVRAIFDSKIPIVSGVGHETDITLCDLAADLRAATPSAAAELIAPDLAHNLNHLHQLSERLLDGIAHHLRRWQYRLQTLQQSLQGQHPTSLLNNNKRQLLHYIEALTLAINKKFQISQLQLQNHVKNLDMLSPLKTLQRGYSITMDENRHVITDHSQIKPSQNIITRVADGEIVSQVTTINKLKK